VSYGRYLAKTLWPRNLAILYAYPKSIPVWQSLGAALLLAAITAAVLLVRRRHPYLLFGWCWFVVGLVPTIGLMQAGRQAMADRFTYIPLLGVFAAAVWGSAAAIGQRPRSAAIFASAVLAVCGVVSWFQVRTWRDSITVFEHAVAVTEPTSVAHRNLGSALQARGDLGGAVLHYEEALRIQPSNFVARYDYGAALLALDKLEEASRQLATVVRECPTCADPYYRLGEIAIRRGNRSEAEILMHEALRRGLEGQAAASARMELAAIEGRRAAAQ
jgi:tetratricopeptide (TPR) repeat protein